MGIPFRRLICASNVNNVLTEFFQTGCYNLTARKLLTTASPAIGNWFFLKRPKTVMVEFIVYPQMVPKCRSASRTTGEIIVYEQCEKPDLMI